LARRLQQLVQRRTACRRTKIAADFSDGRKTFWRNSGLFREQSDQSRVWLMCGETECFLAREAAAAFDL